MLSYPSLVFPAAYSPYKRGKKQNFNKAFLLGFKLCLISFKIFRKFSFSKKKKRVMNYSNANSKLLM